MAEVSYILKIGKIDREISFHVEKKNHRGIIAVRDALRKAGIDSDVLLIHEVKVLD